MKNRNLFVFLIIIFIVTPAIHYFVAGEQYDNTDFRNVVVVLQALVGLILVIMYGRKTKA